MKSRRNGEYLKVGPSVKSRNQQRIEIGHDRYPNSRLSDAPDRSPRARRSLSPHKPDGSKQVLLGNRRSGSIERREYGLHLGGGRSDRVRSRSPSYGKMRKGPHYDEGVVHRKYEYVEPMDFDDGTNSRLKHVYGYDHGFSISKEKDYIENRIVGIDRHWMLDQKSIPLEDDTIRGPYQFSPGLGPTLNYGETGGHVPSFSQSMDIVRVEQERLRYREPLPLDKLAMMESYREGDKHMCNSRDVSYTMVPTSHSKIFVSTSQYNDTVGTSSAISRNEVLVSYRDGVPLPASEEYQRSIGTLVEPVGFSTYGQRPPVDSVRDPEADRENMTSYQRGAYSHTRSEHEEYFYTKPQEIVNDDQAYQSGGLHRMLHSQTQVDYDHSPVDYDRRDLSRTSVMHPVIDRINNNDDSYGNMRNRIILDHPTLQKQPVSDYLDISKSYPLKQGGEYLGSGRAHVEFGRKVSQDNEISHLDVSQEHQISHLRSDFDFSRGPGPEFQKEILQSSPVSRYDSEMRGLALKTQRMKEEERDMYESSDRVLKRKYSMEEDMSRPSYRTIMSSKWNVPEEFEDLYDSDEEWIDEDMFALHSSRSGRFDHNEYRRAERTYDRREHPGHFASDDRLPSQDSLPLTQRPLVRFYKQSGRYVKGHSRPSSLSWHSSRHTDRRSGLHRQHHKVWKRNDGYDEDVRESDFDTSEDGVNLAESEPSDDSEQFKQLVHEAFLKYSKKLNVNPAVQRRYKEQGDAGSLFCIVCGRSLSKEFMDTRRLVTHAFMSHKVGLRAQHLGLHKAICVLLGWNTVVPLDTVTWVPEVLPDTEALAEKEDLILWTPVVVIHNISMSNNSPKEQKVIPVEGIEAFLRGKGFVGGKISLGRPSDQSVMVVKFMGTFSGLANAEKLHMYFAEKKHGRVDFELITSSNCKLNISAEAGRQGDKMEEHLLYGYMGIAEDLDRVDFNTKKWSLIKSKKEIQELANAPVKTR